MVWSKRLVLIFGVVTAVSFNWTTCICRNLRQFESDIREKYSQAARTCDTSFAQALGQFEGLAENMRHFLAEPELSDSQREFYRAHWTLGDSTTFCSLEHSLVPKLRSLAYAETNYLAAAGIIAQCDLSQHSISDVIFKACHSGDFGLVTRIFQSIDDESMFFDAFYGIDSLPEEDRFLESDWRYDEDEFGDLRVMPGFAATVTLDQLNTIKSYGAHIVTGPNRLEFCYKMLGLYLTFGFLDSARALVTFLEPYEPSFFTADDSMQSELAEITEEFAWNVREANWVALYRYHGALSFAYQKLGMHEKLVRSTRMGIIATDRGPYHSVIPSFYNGWFDDAAELGIYDDIADLGARFCYEDRCQSKIASQEADSGRFDRALDRVQTIADGFCKAHALKHMARRLHRAGKNAGAKEMIFLSLETSLGESPDRRTVYSGSDFAISFAANDLADLGLVDDAIATIRSIGDVSIRAEALDYTATKLRSLGANERADSIESAIVAALSVLPDSLRFGQSDCILLKSLLKSGSLHEAESLVVPGPMVPYWLLVLAHGLKGDTVGVLGTLARIDNAYQRVEAIGDCLDSCAALSDTAHASLFFDVFKKTVRVSEVDGYLCEWDCGVSRALLAAASLGNAEFLNWVYSADSSCCLKYAALRCLVPMTAKTEGLASTLIQVDSAFALLKKAVKNDDLSCLDFSDECSSLITTEYELSGRESALNRLHRLSIETNISPSVCRVFSRFAQDGQSTHPISGRGEGRFLHEILEIYARSYLMRQ